MDGVPLKSGELFGDKYKYKSGREFTFQSPGSVSLKKRKTLTFGRSSKKLCSDSTFDIPRTKTSNTRNELVECNNKLSAVTKEYMVSIMG